MMMGTHIQLASLECHVRSMPETEPKPGAAHIGFSKVSRLLNTPTHPFGVSKMHTSVPR